MSDNEFTDDERRAIAALANAKQSGMLIPRGFEVPQTLFDRDLVSRDAEGRPFISDEQEWKFTRMTGQVPQLAAKNIGKV